MIQLDKIKIVTSLNYIKILNENAFQKIIKNGIVTEYRYVSHTPFYLYVELDYLENELVVEFTGKVLKDTYVRLINRDTIRDCLKNINDIGFCSISIGDVIQNSDVVKIDVSKDVACDDCDKLTTFIRNSISNYGKYVVRKMANGNFVVEKNVQTKTLKKRLTIYDKGREILLNSNKSFRQTLLDESVLLQYFGGKVRFELNLNSKEQIRKSLHISDTTLHVVLNADAQPIRDFLNEILSDEDEVMGIEQSKKEYINSLILKDNDYDLAKVEVRMRMYHSPTTHISQVMKPFRTLLSKMQVVGSYTKKSVLGMFAEFVLAAVLVAI